MQRRLLSFLLLFVLTAGAMAQDVPGMKIHSRSVSDFLAAQRILLSNFCRLDFEGARLHPAGWNRFKPFTSLRMNPDFERVVIVVRFDIESTEQPSETVRVNYKAVGSYDSNDGYTTISGNDRAIFRIQEQNNTLMVTEIAPTAPHVSPRAALEWMNMRMNDATTTDLERIHLKDAIGEVSKLVPQPHASGVAK
jgi:hypothetical protein